MTSSRPAYFDSFSPSNRPASARFGNAPSMQLRFAPNNVAERRQLFDRLALFDVIAETCGKRGSPHTPPRSHTRQMKIHSSVSIPSFPLLRIERPLTLLEPCILEKFEGREQDGDGPHAILFACAIPILDNPRE